MFTRWKAPAQRVGGAERTFEQIGDYHRGIASRFASDCNLCYNTVMTKLKVRAIGSSYGVILPKEILDGLNVAEGDELFAIRTPEGLKLTPYNPEFEKWLDAARATVKRYRNDLRALAKL